MGRVNQCQIAFDISIKLHTITSCHSCCGCFIPHCENSLNKFKITYLLTYKLYTLNSEQSMYYFPCIFAGTQKSNKGLNIFALISEQKKQDLSTMWRGPCLVQTPFYSLARRLNSAYSK